MFEGYMCCSEGVSWGGIWERLPVEIGLQIQIQTRLRIQIADSDSEPDCGFRSQILGSTVDQILSEIGEALRICFIAQNDMIQVMDLKI